MAAEPDRPEQRVDIVPMKHEDAQKLARHILEHGTLVYSAHARKAMEDDDIQAPDCENMLRAGKFEPPELEKGELRYRVGTKRMTFVVVFRSREEIRVITAWRNR